MTTCFITAQAAEARDCVTVCDNSTDDWPVETASDFCSRAGAAAPNTPAAAWL
jgi:hypothetical protein